MSLPADSRFADLLRQNSGLTLPADRFTQCLRRLGYADVESAYDQLRRQPIGSAAWQSLLNELSIGETYFFRDTRPLETALRELIARQSDTQHLRVWSAGCATGEEAYTLAMLIYQQLHAHQAAWQISILGTDINESGLKVARQAIYGSWSMRMPDTLARGAFEPIGTRWRVAAAVRQCVNFRILNLADPNTLYPFADLIVCRNVLMYLTPDVQSRVRARLQAALTPGGVLILEDVRVSPTPPPPQEGRQADKLPQTAPLSTLTTAVPNESNLYDLARAAADQQQWAKAHQLLARAPLLDLPCAWLRALIDEQRGQLEDAVQAIRRCLYIDHNFALAYFTLGNLYLAQGKRALAQQQWSNAASLLADTPPSDPLPLGEGITAGEVLAAISAQQHDASAKLPSSGKRADV